jgi:hypothetical protein
MNDICCIICTHVTPPPWESDGEPNRIRFLGQIDTEVASAFWVGYKHFLIGEGTEFDRAVEESVLGRQPFFTITMEKCAQKSLESLIDRSARVVIVTQAQPDEKVGALEYAKARNKDIWLVSPYV